MHCLILYLDICSKQKKKKKKKTTTKPKKQKKIYAFQHSTQEITTVILFRAPSVLDKEMLILTSKARTHLSQPSQVSLVLGKQEKLE